jgi:Leucine-rich repeat (LRR) protein
VRTFWTRQITKLVGLEHNFRLKGLFIQNNQITTLRDSCITELRFLERLDLSNNLLKDLEGTVERLVGLNRLESLGMPPFHSHSLVRFVHHNTWYPIS